MNIYRKYIGALIDTDLYNNYGKLEDLPVLKPEAAQNLCLWMWALALGTVAYTTGIKADRFLTSRVLGALLASGFIALKQWRYYYGGGGAKDGIFVIAIRQASSAESFLDTALSAGGGILLGMAAVPTWWFATVSAYSGLVVARCHVTLRRPRYWNHAGSPASLSFIPNCLFMTNDENTRVGDILAGWVLSHTCMFVLGLAVSFCLSFEWPSELAFWIALPSFFLVFFLGLRRLSERFGKYVLRRYIPVGVTRAIAGSN